MGLCQTPMMEFFSRSYFCKKLYQKCITRACILLTLVQIVFWQKISPQITFIRKQNAKLRESKTKRHEQGQNNTRARVFY